MDDGSQPTPIELTILAGAGATLVGSFLHFSGTADAWSAGAFPLVTLIPLYVAIAAAHVAFDHWGRVRVPSVVGLGITWRQLDGALAGMAFVMSLLWLMVQGNHPGIGLWFFLVGTGACTIGTQVRARELAPSISSGAPVTAVGGRLNPAGIAALAGAAVLLLGSFLPLVHLHLSLGNVVSFTDNRTAWSTNYLFPVTILPIACALVIAAHIGFTTFGHAQFSDHVGPYGWSQLYVLLAAQAAVMQLAILIMDKGGYTLGIGYWLMLAGSVSLFAGAALARRGAWR